MHAFCITRQTVNIVFYLFMTSLYLWKDGVDEKLNFIRLKWDHHGGNEACREDGEVYYLCPLDRVGVRVHVLSSNALVHLLHDTVSFFSGVLMVVVLPL